ncbi:MAG TPA: hypothetical protein VN132_03685 [Bdellovibrio sp.]|nr:hypothetical protein [Bdellovibrio sp.]
MDLVMAMSLFFVIITMIFVAIALLLPEWMGITGKRAKKIIADQQEEKPVEAKDDTKDSQSSPQSSNQSSTDEKNKNL